MPGVVYALNAFGAHKVYVEKSEEARTIRQRVQQQINQSQGWPARHIKKELDRYEPQIQQFEQNDRQKAEQARKTRNQSILRSSAFLGVSAIIIWCNIFSQK